MQIGLKLWSVNRGACAREAARLFEDGVFDYLELYAVPGSAESLPEWKSLQIPCVIHAPHFKHGFNLAVAECESANRRLYDETRRFADELGASRIIFHGGTFGSMSETSRQLKALREPRALIENKPCITSNEGRILECRGSGVEEISMVLQEVGCGFCLDIPHALCAANYKNLEQLSLLREMNRLNPVMYHLADMKDAALHIDDHTPLGQGVLDLETLVAAALRPGAMVTIESKRTHPESLAEFEQEVKLLRAYVGNSSD